MSRSTHRARARGSGWAALSARALVLWRSIRYSYWFVPSLMAVGAVLLAIATNTADERFDAPDWLAVEDADNVRALLTTIAGSMITVAGVTFSIVIVALSLASSQFGPRLLVNFMRDTGNQVVLGTYVSTYLFCLLVLRKVEGGGDDPYIPQYSAVAAVVLAVLSVGVLIYFFHHVSMSIQAGHLVTVAGQRLEKTVRSAFPESASGGEAVRRGGARRPEGWPEDFAADSATVPARDCGYLDVVDVDLLVDLAVERDLYIEVVPKPGDFFVDGGDLARVHPAASLDDEVSQKVVEACLATDQRGDAETLALAADRLTEVAVRALSPGINDPYTALACIDRLSAALAIAAERGAAGPFCLDEDGTPRLRLGRHSLIELVDRGLGRIRHYGRTDLDILLRLLRVLSIVAEAAARAGTGSPALADALTRNARLILDSAENALEHDWERQQVRDRHDEVLALLNRPDRAVAGGAGDS